jgi:hypothetical protein
MTICSFGCGGSGGSGGSGGAGGGATSTTTQSSSTGTIEPPTCAGGTVAECGAPAVCNHPVTPEMVAENPPAMTGGTITDGTYVLVGYRIYTGPGGMTGMFPNTFEMVITIAGSELKGTVKIGDEEQHYAGQLSTASGKFDVTNTCPTAGPDEDPDPYTADGDTIRILNGEKDDQEVIYVRAAP